MDRSEMTGPNNSVKIDADLRTTTYDFVRDLMSLL